MWVQQYKEHLFIEQFKHLSYPVAGANYLLNLFPCQHWEVNQGHLNSELRNCLACGSWLYKITNSCKTYKSNNYIILWCVALIQFLRRNIHVFLLLGSFHMKIINFNGNLYIDQKHQRINKTQWMGGSSCDPWIGSHPNLSFKLCTLKRDLAEIGISSSSTH